jgi:hypothetical protein
VSSRRAAVRRAAQCVAATLVPRDVNLATAHNPLANHAETLVVERCPFPLGVGALQDGEAIFGIDMSVHVELFLPNENVARVPSQSAARRNGV